MTQRKVLKSTLVAATLLGLAYSGSLSANVSLKNGNFFVGYTDIVYPGGFEPKVERVYNSKTPFKGMFGFGWGNEYEVFLTVSADGSVVVHEYGGGAENRFSPLAFKSEELDKAVDSIASVAQKAGVAGNAEQLASYKKHLRTDASFRNDEWEKFRSQNKLQPRQLPNNAKLTSNRFSYQYITKTTSGYIRTFDTGKTENYDESGHLVRISDKNNNFIELSYEKGGHLHKLIDNFNRKMFFTFNEQGLLTTIEGENSKKATFKYNNQGELINSKDVDGNVYNYKYDSNSRHNMILIEYSDKEKTTMAMTYYGRDKHENIKSVKERDGTLTEYLYDNDTGDKSHYSASVNTKGADGKKISSSKYEYFIKNKQDGEEWTYRMITTIDGDRTETTYNECCGLPLLIKHGAEETTFAYDIKGHVTKKTTPNEVTELHYDERAGKVNSVTRYSKVNKADKSWSKFEYDKKANLISAVNSEGKKVKLLYDMSGRISTLVDQNRRQISFKYNENSKPIEIRDPALGTITVSYTNSGEIKKVDSTAGRKIALQVTSAFQNLLDIIRPAGVTLSF
jgi:YD repeat-containing protein